MAAGNAVSLKDYLSGKYERDMEFVDGAIEERTGFSWNHAMLLSGLCYWFWEHRDEWHVDGFCSYWVMTTATRVRMPDLCVVKRSDPVEKVRVTAPLLCIELLEPEDRPGRAMKRLDEFVAMGTEHIWILDPSDRSAATYTRFGMKPVSGARLEVAGTEIYLDVTAMFALLDEGTMGPA